MNITDLPIEIQKIAKRGVSPENIQYKFEKGNVIELHISNQEIPSVSIIEDFSHLRKLHINNCVLENISSIADLYRLHTINLSNNEIRDLSPLTHLTKLRELYLSDNAIQDISPLQKLHNLTRLSVHSNRIRDISPLTELYGLYTLSLADNSIDDIGPLHAMVSLRHLVLSDNLIPYINALTNLRNLLTLKLDKNAIEDITPIQNANKLISLDLEDNNITEIPDLKLLESLAFLNLKNNSIQKVLGIRNLLNLVRLDLSKNEVIDISPIKNLSRLTELYLADNRISKISALKNLSRLVSLSLANNDIVDIEPIRFLNKITVLDLSGNSVDKISHVNTLYNLSILNLASNKINNVRSLKGIVNLRELNIDSNKIANIHPILNLSSLTTVSIFDNPISQLIPKEVLQAGWSAIKDRYESIGQNENLTKIREAKLLLLGNSNVGKSDLLSFLSKGIIPETHDSTHGLSYEIIENFLPESKIHCWDFGGQEFYHATHQLFFSPGALHILIWSKNDVIRTDSEFDSFFEKKYWLRCIEQLSNTDKGQLGIETIILENKIDEQNYLPSYLNQEDLQKDFPNLQLQFLNASIKYKRRIEGLKEIIKERLETLFKEHPPKYIEYQEIINESSKVVLSIEELANDGDKRYASTAMQVLHNIGCILYFPNVIPDKVFIKPSLLLDLLYNNILSSKNKEKITIEELTNSIAGNFLSLSLEEVISLLIHFHLVFKIPNESNTFYIPQYLADAPAWVDVFERHQFKKVLTRIVSDTYLMHNAMLRIFSKYAEYMKTDPKGNAPLFWKDGLVIEKEGQALLIRFNRAKQCIDLYTDVEENNFRLQLDVIDFIVNMDNNSLVGKIDNNTSKIQRKSLEPWESKYFDVLISVEGRYYSSWKTIVEKRQKGINNIETFDKDGVLKVLSVFDFNRYLPKSERGQMKKLFISYSKLDLELVNKFQEHLAALKLDGKIATWYCTELTAGSDWNAEIQEHFDAADIVCFMISPNFMKTKYIHEHEIDKAFKRKEKDNSFLVVPIMLDFCRWSTTKNDLSQFTALPYTAKPVMDFKNQNMAWYLVQECLRLIIDKNFQSQGDDLYNHTELPTDVKKLYERIVSGRADA